MIETVEQIKKQTIIMRLAVSIYNMSDYQLPLLIDALEQRAAAGEGQKQSDGVVVEYPADATIHRQLRIARVFVLINQLDFKTLLDRLSLLSDPEMQWVRAFPRIPCYLVVDFASKGKAYRSCIRDISASGVFIETADIFEMGQVVDLCFSLHEAGETLPFKIKGCVKRVCPDGIGVQYQQMTHYRREIIDTLINKIG